MPQSLAAVYLHLIWSTKDRAAVLTDEVRPQLHAYMAGIFQDLDCPALLINSVPDHVHALCRYGRDIRLRDLLKEVKAGSSTWIKTPDAGGRAFRNFHWQTGYGAFSVSASQLPHVKRYIMNQEAHHKETSFQDEYREFLKCYQIEYDEKYVWD